MKKILTLLAVVLIATANINAQTVTITKTDDTKIVLDASEIKKIEFRTAEEEEKTLISEFTGYILVTTKFFKNKYFGNNAKLSVYRSLSGKVSCTLSDPQWGEGKFDIQMGSGTMSGTGTMTITDPQTKTAKTYKAKLEGQRTNFNIVIDELMGGTTINWVHSKTEPRHYAITGKYEGIDNINVVLPYKSNSKVTYEVTANADGTINLVVPEMTYEGTPLGTIIVGTYTIPNIPYNEKERAFVKHYKDDKISFHFKARGMDNDYVFDKDDCRVVVSKSDAGDLDVHNIYKVGKMPILVKGSFTGKKK